jgi:hypothetical protein
MQTLSCRQRPYPDTVRSDLRLPIQRQLLTDSPNALGVLFPFFLILSPTRQPQSLPDSDGCLVSVA